MAFDLPRTLTLPSGLRVTVRDGTARPRPPGLFGDVLALGLELPVDIEDLVLADFHVLRAVLAKAGRIEEDEEEITCQNCDAALALKPCSRLETGPWEHGEADDPELDRTGPFGTMLDCGVVLAQRTVREARALWDAPSPFAIDAAIVTALGIERLGEATDTAAIARDLETLDDDAYDAVVDAWLDAHYPLRLGADIRCPDCNARNTIDAPADRELDRGAPRPHAGGGPDLVVFVERAHAIAEPMLAAHPDVELVIEDGTPAVDDGGEPLLGSYLPPPPADAAVPTRAPTITIYWRTFVAALDDDDFDWEDELRETIEHELEHHVFFLEGHDPMDEEERAAIVRDEVRLVGRRAASQRALGMFGGSIRDFARRAWPLVVIAALVLAVSIAESRCAE